jgi:hypothetical protein
MAVLYKNPSRLLHPKPSAGVRTPPVFSRPVCPPSNHPKGMHGWSSDPSHHIHPSIRNSSQHCTRPAGGVNLQRRQACCAERQHKENCKSYPSAQHCPPELLSSDTTGNKTTHNWWLCCAAAEPLRVSHGHATAGRLGDGHHHHHHHHPQVVKYARRRSGAGWVLL